MTDPVPSKEQDYLAKLQDSHPMVQLQREVDRLQRQQTNLIAALGEAQAKIDELSIHAEKWVKRATTPAHEREMPHCSTCACPPYDAKALDEARRFKVGDEVPIAHWGATSKIVSIHCTLANGETIAVDCIAPEPCPDARMKAALELMALNVQQEDENGPVAGALHYSDVEMICYHGLGLIPMADPDLRARLDKLEQIERERSSQPPGDGQ